jgi:hypothetical protein
MRSQLDVTQYGRISIIEVRANKVVVYVSMMMMM